MGIKAERGKSVNAERLCGNGSCNDAEKCGRTFNDKAFKVGHNTFCGNGGKQKILRSRNNVDPGNRQPKYNTPNQNS